MVGATQSERARLRPFAAATGSRLDRQSRRRALRPEFRGRGVAVFQCAAQSEFLQCRQSCRTRAPASSQVKPDRAVFLAGAESRDKTTARRAEELFATALRPKPRTTNHHRPTCFTSMRLMSELPRPTAVAVWT